MVFGKSEKYKTNMINTHIYGTRRVWIFVICMLIILDCYFHIYVYYNILQSPERQWFYGVKTYDVWTPRNIADYYKYPLINGSKTSMDYEIGYNSSYYWFTSMKHLLKDLSSDATPMYPMNTPICKLNTTLLERINVSKIKIKLEWVEVQNPDVALGGYYAPADCRPKHRVAVIIPYRDRPDSLNILLNYLHPLLKKQLLEYRIFVIEQYGTENFNKGTLYNIAFLESQRFGTWDCLIFHDVDLVPADERISYSCPEHPTHMSTVNESWGDSDPLRSRFGGVTALTPQQYEAVNGYSNLYWDWGVEDSDLYDRLQSKNFSIARYNSSITRYTVLAHPFNHSDNRRTLLLTGSKLRFRRDDLTSTKYNLVNVTQMRMFTHILADVNPTNMPLDPKSLMHRLFHVTSNTYYGHLQYK